MIPTLPIAQYPQIAPPVVTVTATYIGASPQAVEAQVTTPLEQAVNTVQGLRYISSTSAQGVSTITLTFNLGVDLDIAAADVQNAAAVRARAAARRASSNWASRSQRTPARS